MQDKGQRNVKAASQLPWGGPHQAQARQDSKLKELGPTEMGRTPETRRKPGYAGSRHREK